MEKQQGGCLCRAIRYEVSAEPARVTFCHCRFCQRATGGAYLVEPIFDLDDLAVIQGTPSRYSHVSAGSGKLVHVHFCATCGTKLYLTFERFAGFAGLFGGTFDAPGWYPVTPDNAKHIFLKYAQPGSVIPAGFNTFSEHATHSDGRPIAPRVYAQPHVIGTGS